MFGGKSDMNITDAVSVSGNDKTRIIQELVPGKQITIAHIIASPDDILYKKLGLNPEIDYNRDSIGIVNVSPAETAVIAADIAMKSSNVELGFVDRFSGTLIITGTVSNTETAVRSICEYAHDKLGFAVCEVTKT